MIKRSFGRAAAILLVLALCLALSGCNTQPAERTPSTYSRESVAAAEAPAEMNLGDTVTIGDLELTLVEADYAQMVRPVNRHGIFGYLTDIEGEQFILITGTIRNNGETNWAKSAFFSTIWVDSNPDKLYRTVFLIENIGKGFVEEVEAGAEERFHLVTTVSDELLEQANEIVFELGLRTDGETPASFADCDGCLRVTVTRDGSNGNPLVEMVEPDAETASESTWDAWKNQGKKN